MEIFCFNLQVPSCEIIFKKGLSNIASSLGLRVHFFRISEYLVESAANTYLYSINKGAKLGVPQVKLWFLCPAPKPYIYVLHFLCPAPKFYIYMHLRYLVQFGASDSIPRYLVENLQHWNCERMLATSAISVQTLLA